MKFRLTVWKTVHENYSKEYPGTPEGYGEALKKAKERVSVMGGSPDRVAEVWPDLGSPFPVATRVGGDVTVSVQYL